MEISLDGWDIGSFDDAEPGLSIFKL